MSLKELDSKQCVLAAATVYMALVEAGLCWSGGEGIKLLLHFTYVARQHSSVQKFANRKDIPKSGVG